MAFIPGTIVPTGSLQRSKVSLASSFTLTTDNVSGSYWIERVA